MTSAHFPSSSALDDRILRRRRIRAILLPVEHGGWGLTLEPLVAGMVVAPSLAGLAIAVAILMAFLARQPLRIVIRPGQSAERLKIALLALAIEGSVLVGMISLAMILGAREAVLLLLASSPLALFLLYRDRERRSRDLGAEMAAALYMSCGAVALGIGGGRTMLISATLGALVAARSVGVILHVREQVKIMRHRPASRSASIIVHGAALAGVIVAVGYGLVNLFAVAAFAVLLARAVYPTVATSATQLGWAEVKMGLVSVLLISLSLM